MVLTHAPALIGIRARVTPFGNYSKHMIVSIYLVSIYAMTMSSIAPSINEFQSAHWMLSDFQIALLNSTTLFDFEL